MDILITLHRKLQKAVDLFGIRPIAQKVFRRLYVRHYTANRLARAAQNGREWWLDPDVALRGEFQEYDTVAWLREVIQPGMTVIDVGANVGQMTLEMAHLVGPTGKVIAIEPAPGNVELLRRHVIANEFRDRVEIVAAACTDEEGELDFIIYGQHADAVGSGHQMLAIRKGTGEAVAQHRQVVKVRANSLDGLCARFGVKPDVLKIDVEGAEILVLRGARSVLAACRPRTRIGFHPFAFDDPKAAAVSILNLFLEFGFEQVGEIPPSQWQLAEYVFEPAIRRTVAR